MCRTGHKAFHRAADLVVNAPDWRVALLWTGTNAMSKDILTLRLVPAGERVPHIGLGSIHPSVR